MDLPRSFLFQRSIIAGAILSVLKSIRTAPTFFTGKYDHKHLNLIRIIHKEAEAHTKDVI